MTARTEVRLHACPQVRETVSPASITVTERVFETLDERGWTPERLAGASGIGCIRLSGRLNLQAPWSLTELEGLSEAFGVPVSFWLASEAASPVSTVATVDAEDFWADPADHTPGGAALIHFGVGDSGETEVVLIRGTMSVPSRATLMAALIAGS